MNKKYIPIEGHPNLVRDSVTNAIINTDKTGAIAAKQRKEEYLKQKFLVEKHDNELSEIKGMLKEILVEQKTRWWHRFFKKDKK